MSEPTAQDAIDESVAPTQDELFIMESATAVENVTRLFDPQVLKMIGRECPFCEKYVTDEQYPEAYFEMTTWVHGPKKNGDVFRNYTGTSAHAECVQRAAAGIAPDQGSLFDE